MRQRSQVQEVLRLDRRGVTASGGADASGDDATGASLSIDGGASADSGKLSVSWVAKQLLGRAFWPGHALRRSKLRRNHARTPTVEANAQLLLYNQMLPGDFLHYGYFDDPTTSPETISFDDLYQAQLRYARKVVAAIGPPNPGSPVLDAGSGMGGMLAVLKAAGHEATGLTPDRYQVEHIRRAYPDVPVLHCRFEDLLVGERAGRFEDLPVEERAGRFEDLPVSERAGRFGTVVHAESIQYMDPDRVFGVVDRALARGGRWIVADYFRTAAGNGSDSEGDLAASASDRSGWRLDAFREHADRAGYCVAHEEDMTPHVLPTLGFARLLAERIGLPVFDFATDKLRAKRPGAHYVLEPVADRTRQQLLRNMEALDPERFSRRKRYLLMKMQRK